MEGVDGAVERLMEEQIVEIIGTAFGIDAAEPRTAQEQQNAPCTPTPVTADRADAACQQEIDDRPDQRDQYSDRAFAENRQKDIERKEKLFAPQTALTRQHPIEASQREDDEHAHEHVLPHDDHHAEEQSAAEHHPPARTARLPGKRTGRPTIHHAGDDEGRNEREERQEGHAMAAEEPPAQHDRPEIEGRFVGIGYTLIGEGEEIAFAQRLIDDAQVTQFVARRIVAQQ